MLARTDQLALGYAAVTAASVGLFGFSLLTMGLPALLFAVLLADGIARPSSGLLYPTRVHGPRRGNRVALTFDDGPDPAVTPLVLDELARRGARASFFVIGQKLEQAPELARRMLAEGHELGNHSWRHSRWQNFWGTAAQAEEVRRGEQSIAAFTGNRTRPLFRPPIGLKSPPLARAAQQLGLTICAWSLHARDTRGASPEQVASRVLGQVRAGDIILMHDGHDLPGRSRPGCAQATALILAGLREKGLESVTVSELLARRGTGDV
jgi:peptidoglycan/xylan/chitin deacetylase (PgdA/CDA1 family)